MMRAMSRSRAFSTAGSEKIAMVGSGNFGSALVRILGRNALKHDVFDNEVKMYVHEEMIDGKPLTSIINETNENVKYLKGAKFTKIDLGQGSPQFGPLVASAAQQVIDDPGISRMGP